MRSVQGQESAWLLFRMKTGQLLLEDKMRCRMVSN